MRNILIAAVLLSLGMFTACAQSKKVAKATKAKKSTMAKNSLKISTLTMRRSACYGKCPEYSITVSSNGQVEYNGTRNATPMGLYKKNIGVEKARVLLQDCVEYKVDTCADLYKMRLPDLPGLHFVFTINGKEKWVTNAQEGPPFFQVLAEEVDRLGTPDATWKKSE